MKLAIKQKEYVVKAPKILEGVFTITRSAYNARAAIGKEQPLRRLVKQTKARRVFFPDLPSVRFYVHPNEMNGMTVTESRTGMALHKSVENKSVELCLSEATAKLEIGFRNFKGPQGFKKHIDTLPSKEEYTSLPKKRTKLCNLSPRQ